MSEIDNILLAVVSLAMDELEDKELLALNLSALLGQPFKGKFGADKISSLYTKGEYEMADDVKKAFIIVANHRIQEMSKKQK